MEEAGLTTLVFIPGMLSDERIWRPVADRLPGDRRIVDLDGLDSIPAMAERALAASAGPLVLLGHSMGARVAQVAALQAPERVGGLVLANCGALPAEPEERRRRLADLVLARKDMRSFAAHWVPPLVADGGCAEIVGMVAAIPAERLDREVRAMLSRPDTFARLHRIVCPTLLLAGEADTATPLVAVQKMAREMPSAGLRSLRGGGHFLPLERAETVAELIGVWLETLDAPHTLTD
ncbi:Pimeloyl-ACP methyl ester carboxylesterase [Salipiger thiooxidans]|uniref:Pimeloyl-ACP methyl ester carboxylesterase n=1 Tax=Salipiger thiooxidans TaxID=282683 RepID=A0A1G7GAV6_9RHOB|nr:Pimeloyl-ACP methyl ester carboxylesterase [Salipiger thiooxidans]